VELERRNYEKRLESVKSEFIRELEIARNKTCDIQQNFDKTRRELDKTVSQKDKLESTVANLENEIIQIKHDFNKKERQYFNIASVESREKELVSWCQTLTLQLEELRQHLKTTQDKMKRNDNELSVKNEQIQTLK
jgi:uncharacterized protein (DUF3084 family)